MLAGNLAYHIDMVLAKCVRFPLVLQLLKGLPRAQIFVGAQDKFEKRALTSLKSRLSKQDVRFWMRVACRTATVLIKQRDCGLSKSLLTMTPSEWRMLACAKFYCMYICLAVYSAIVACWIPRLPQVYANNITYLPF